MVGRADVTASLRILLVAADVVHRRDAAAGPLAPLAGSLAADLTPLVERARDVAPAELLPPEKARMTRIGGRCAVDGSLLAFDPFAAHRHRCAACGREYARDEDYRWWIIWYQLWLAERAVHGAVLALTVGDETGATIARGVLAGAAERYLAYPNRDNVLGPTRPFFSTYLESIWLLQLCVALDLLEALPNADARVGGAVRDRVIEPSRALIASYDEGRSNRQVWNAAALAAAARLLGDDAGLERALLGASGVAALLGDGLLADGTWYEGENYHQFAHRGLWYGVTIAERAGVTIAPALVRRFDAGFVAPFLTAMPDLTFPARRDSQWAVSLRQWRYAESCELGLARGPDASLLLDALAALYDADAPVPRRDTGRARSAAESERNEPATRLSRADLGWRSLLFALPELPNGGRWAPQSVHLEAQGLAVFRRKGGVLWAALDYGNSGGSHGHPDRLDLLLADGARRWLDDMGTGSYVDRSLHWYRSTLAHNAPLVDGRSQLRVDGLLTAYDERDDWGWIDAAASIAPGVVAHRALVVADDYVIDRLTWTADRDVAVDLPMHVDAAIVGGAPWRMAVVAGAGGLEDGFDFLTDVESLDVNAGMLMTLAVDDEACAWVHSPSPTTWNRALAPGAPGQGSARFSFVRRAGRAGVLTTVWSPRRTIANVVIDDAAIVVSRRDGRIDRHVAGDREWRVTERSAAGMRDVVLRGAVASARAAVVRHPRTAPSVRSISRHGEPLRFALAAQHYRRSEQTWHEAGEPRAIVSLAIDGDALSVTVDVDAPRPCFVPLGADNPLDNERAQTNGHGVQLHLQRGRTHDSAVPQLSWLLIPNAEPTHVYVTATSAAAGAIAVVATWSATERGFVTSVRVPFDASWIEPGDETFGVDVLVNETTPERERRRGQLVLSGADGEFVYLRGDRQDPARFVRFRLAP